jgi:lipopolysaccharide transport protein LptA
MNTSATLLSLTAALALLAGAARAEGTNTRVRLTADNIEYFPKNGFTVCESNVVVTFDTMTLRADRVVAYQDSTAPLKNKESFSRIVATGNVHLRTDQHRVYGQRGVYETASRTVQVTGSPLVELEGGQQVRANVIIYDLVKDKISFLGAEGGMTMTDEISKEWSDFNPAGGK